MRDHDARPPLAASPTDHQLGRGVPQLPQKAKSSGSPAALHFGQSHVGALAHGVVINAACDAASAKPRAWIRYARDYHAADRVAFARKVFERLRPDERAQSLLPSR